MAVGLVIVSVSERKESRGMGGGTLVSPALTNRVLFSLLVLKELLLDVLLELRENDQITSRWLVHSQPRHPSVNREHMYTEIASLLPIFVH